MKGVLFKYVPSPSLTATKKTITLLTTEFSSGGNINNSGEERDAHGGRREIVALEKERERERERERTYCSPI